MFTAIYLKKILTNLSNMYAWEELIFQAIL